MSKYQEMKMEEAVKIILAQKEEILDWEFKLQEANKKLKTLREETLQEAAETVNMCLENGVFYDNPIETDAHYNAVKECEKAILEKIDE